MITGKLFAAYADAWPDGMLTAALGATATTQHLVARLKNDRRAGSSSLADDF